MSGVKALVTQIHYTNVADQHKPLREELLEAMGAVLDHGQFIVGREVDEFERRFADLCRVKFAVAVNSGTDALILALRVLGIAKEDEIITVPNSFVASTACITIVGAQPVFVDIDEDLNMDPRHIEQTITRKTKAILPVHLTGRPADMDPIVKIAKQHNLYVIEDCAQAVMAEYRGQSVGSIGHIGCFSLHPLKTLNACGDGGVLTTNNKEIYERLRIMRSIGLRTRDECLFWSGNSRLDTLQAAILLVKLKYVESWTTKRRANARFYQTALNGIKDLTLPNDKPHEKAVYHTFVIQTDRRDELKKHLNQHGIETAIHYPVPIHLQPAAASLGHKRGSFPVAERQAERVLSLPIYPELSHADLQYVAETIRGFYK